MKHVLGFITILLNAMMSLLNIDRCSAGSWADTDVSYSIELSNYVSALPCFCRLHPKATTQWTDCLQKCQCINAYYLRKKEPHCMVREIQSGSPPHLTPDKQTQICVNPPQAILLLYGTLHETYGDVKPEYKTSKAFWKLMGDKAKCYYTCCRGKYKEAERLAYSYSKGVDCCPPTVNPAQNSVGANDPDSDTAGNGASAANSGPVLMG